MLLQRREIPPFSKNNFLKIGHNNVKFSDTVIALVILKTVLFIFSCNFFKLLAVNGHEIRIQNVSNISRNQISLRKPNLFLDSYNNYVSICQ
jgi:hypothetical protein